MCSSQYWITSTEDLDWLTSDVATYQKWQLILSNGLSLLAAADETLRVVGQSLLGVAKPRPPAEKTSPQGWHEASESECQRCTDCNQLIIRAKKRKQHAHSFKKKKKKKESNLFPLSDEQKQHAWKKRETDFLSFSVYEQFFFNRQDVRSHLSP